MPSTDPPSSLLANSSDDFRLFWTERHLGTLSTVRTDGSVHVVPVGVTVDFTGGVARVITSATSVKARRVAAAGGSGLAGAICQVDGRRWSTLEGLLILHADQAAVLDAEQRYAARYRQPRPNPSRVVLQLTVGRVLGNA